MACLFFGCWCFKTRCDVVKKPSDAASSWEALWYYLTVIYRIRKVNSVTVQTSDSNHNLMRTRCHKSRELDSHFLFTVKNCSPFLMLRFCMRVALLCFS